MRTEAISNFAILLGRITDLAFGIWLVMTADYYFLSLLLWLITKIIINIINFGWLNNRNLLDYLIAIFHDSFVLLFIFFVTFARDSFSEKILFLLTMLFAGVFLHQFLFYREEGISRSGVLKPVATGDLFVFVENMNNKNKLNLLLNYKEKKDNVEANYRVYVDEGNNIVMGEGFYRTTELQIKQKLSILAHEIGHRKNNHSIKMICIRIAVVVIIIPVIFYGVSVVSEADFLALGLLLMLRPVCQILANAYSFKQEYEADRFSVRNAASQSSDLICALKFLSYKCGLAIETTWWHKLFLTDHPSVQSRQLYITGLAAEKK